MADVLLVLNAGSSSIKFRAFDAQPAEPALILQGQVDGLYTASAKFRCADAQGARIGEKSWESSAQPGHHDAVETIADFLRSHREGHRLVAVGHRVVHGGTDYGQPVLITPDVIARLEKLSPLAPLHQPNNLAPVRVLAQADDELLVGCNYLAHRASKSRDHHSYIGTRRDTLRRVGDSFQISCRRLELDEFTLMSANVSILL